MKIEYSKDLIINEQLVKMFKAEEERMKTTDLTLFLKKVFPNMTEKEGKIIWDILENKKLIVNGKDIAGTFRYNASCIASVVGNRTDYMDFYCSWIHSQREQEFIKKIEEAGGKIEPL